MEAGGGGGGGGVGRSGEGTGELGGSGGGGGAGLAPELLGAGGGGVPARAAASLASQEWSLAFPGVALVRSCTEGLLCDAARFLDACCCGFFGCFGPPRSSAKILDLQQARNASSGPTQVNRAVDLSEMLDKLQHCP